MKELLIFSLFGFLTSACLAQKSGIEETESKVKFDQQLATELSSMVEIDQIAAFMHGDGYNFTPEQWKSFQDSVFTKHQIRIEEIFVKHGFVGYDLAGQEGSNHFWLLTQHSDNNPKFQNKILKKMKIQVDKGNANSRDYGFLVDRVNLNMGKPQIYGTQVAYRKNICQAYPKNLIDSLNVNKRRKSIGLEPLKDYLNFMTKMHFDMNKESFLTQGIKKPTLYE